MGVEMSCYRLIAQCKVQGEVHMEQCGSSWGHQAATEGQQLIPAVNNRAAYRLPGHGGKF